MKPRHVIALDLGGTNLRLGLVGSKGRILRRRRLKMMSFARKEALLAWLAGAIDQFAASTGGLALPDAVAIGFAGPTDSRAGRVYCAPNVGGLVDIDVASGLRRLVGLPVVVENDANCAALGEFWQGAGRGASSLFLFTVGTGIGGGFVVDGKIWRGYDGIAGEIGHSVVMVGGPKCGCGKRGCLEAMVSATAIVRDYKAGGRRLARGRPHTEVTARMIFSMARRGDRHARHVIATAGGALGVGIANIFHILNPELILIGGGVSRAGAALLGPATEAARCAVFAPLRDRLQVKRASLGDDAGILGAAYLAFSKQ
jgi:glucokinase